VIGTDVNILFWLSIGLWMISLVSYALILSGHEQLDRKDARMSFFIPFEVLFHSSGYSRYVRYLYRILVVSAVGAVLTGGLFLLTGTS
jgi:hypothetical protein